jgi:hypothetical protein
MFRRDKKVKGAKMMNDKYLNMKNLKIDKEDIMMILVGAEYLVDKTTFQTDTETPFKGSFFML